MREKLMAHITGVDIAAMCEFIRQNWHDPDVRAATYRELDYLDKAIALIKEYEDALRRAVDAPPQYPRRRSREDLQIMQRSAYATFRAT